MVYRSPLRASHFLGVSVVAVAILVWYQSQSGHPVLSADPSKAVADPLRKEIVKSVPPEPPSVESMVRDANRELMAKLGTRISVDFDDISLVDAVDFLSRTAKLPIRIDRTSLEDEGIAPEHAVTLRARDLTLRSVFRHILQPLHLEAVVRDEMVLVTTNVRAGEFLRVVVYDLSELLSEGHNPTELMNLITTIVESDTWETVGGPGSLMITGELLAVRQIDGVHEALADLLHQLRVSCRKQAVHQDHVLRVYPLKGGGTDAKANEITAIEVANILRKCVAPASWDEKEARLEVVGRTLVIRQTPARHVEVVRLLRQMLPEEFQLIEFPGGKLGKIPFNGGIGRVESPR